MSASNKAAYHPETELVHGGTMRSNFGETSEALFLTQGFVYDSAEQCEARFSGKEPGYVYSRYSNPNMTMFEQRMAASEDRDQYLLDHFILANNHFRQFVLECVVGPFAFLHGGHFIGSKIFRCHVFILDS